MNLLKILKNSANVIYARYIKNDEEAILKFKNL